MSYLNETVILCRVCLRSDAKLRRKGISIFDKHEDTLISDSINLIANVKIKQGDGLPEKICPDCLLELYAALNFKLKCENSNTLLKTTLLYSTKAIEYDTAQNIDYKDPTTLKEEPIEIEYLDNDFFSDNNDLDKHQLDNKGKFTSEIKLESSLDEPSLPEDITPVFKRKSVDFKFQCNECGEVFKSKCKMRVHWKKSHLFDSLICQICKRAFKSYNSFNRHKKSNSATCSTAPKITIEGVGKSRVFHCKECFYKSIRMKDLITHLRIHTGDRPYICDLCGKSYSQLSSLNGHRETTHKIIQVEITCHYCGKILRGRGKAYKHLKLHQSTHVQCDICKKIYKSKPSLIAHLPRHSGTKSYTCEKCAQSFYTISELCNHRRGVHEKNKHTYKCDICQFEANTSTKIKNHKSKHTSTNIPCLLCGMFSENAKAFSIHQKRHFAERNYPCPHCEKKFMDSKTRSKHVTKVHRSKFLLNASQKIKKENNNSPKISCPDFSNMVEIEIQPLEGK